MVAALGRQRQVSRPASLQREFEDSQGYREILISKKGNNNSS